MDLFRQLRPHYETAVEQGLIRTKKHPELKLWIHNYTDKAQATTGAWDNPAVRACRGLITDINDQVVARPFEKFFNYGQQEAPLLNVIAPALVTDKLDGSLGILYPTGKTRTAAGALLVPEFAVATRGSFTSDQALHATEVYRERYHDWSPPKEYTALFEIVYPENRIVVDYGALNDLVLIAFVHNVTGDIREPQWLEGISQSNEWDRWQGPRAKKLPYYTLADALAAEPRENAEGFVVRVGTKSMVKIKQEDYLELHRVITGLSERRIWEYLGEHGELDSLLETLPDEFHEWAKGIAGALISQRDREYNAAVLEFHRLIESLEDSLGRDWERKQFAAWAKNGSTNPSYLFSLLDGKDILPMIWKSLKPIGETSPFRREDLELAA